MIKILYGFLFRKCFLYHKSLILANQGGIKLKRIESLIKYVIHSTILNKLKSIIIYIIIYL